MENAVGTVRLLLLPLFKKAPSPGPKGPLAAKRAAPAWKSEIHQGVGEALIDLRELANLVSSLMADGKAAVVHETEDWLSDIRSCIKEMILLAQEGPYDVFESERDALPLADIVDCRPDMGKSKRSYPGKMLEFWVNEVSRRCEEIISLCVHEIAVMDIVKTQSTLRGLPYPPT